MPMVPLSFVLAAILLVVLLRALTESDLGERNPFMAIFIAVVTANLVLVGLHFGYEMFWIKKLQPFTGAVLPPLAFLAFRNPEPGSAMGRRLWLHAIPLVCAVLAMLFALYLVEVTQGLFSLGYMVALALLGMGGQDAMPWPRLDRITNVERALWLVVVLLLISGLTDIAIAIDVWLNQGTNIPRIVGATTLLGAVLAVVAFVRLIPRSRHKQLRTANAAPVDAPAVEVKAVVDDEDSEQHQSVAARVDQLMNAASMHRDPDLNLNRLARKLGVPARRVSIAINRTHGVSVSHYVNERRIADACDLLTGTDEPVTTVMLKCGFNTKSNFNREFKRVTGMSPSAWRASSGVAS